MPIPPALAEIVTLFAGMTEPERREMLVHFAESASQYEPVEGEVYAIRDVRRDEQCTDTVGVFFRVGEEGGAHFAFALGPKVQTLTRALASILARGFGGAKIDDVLSTESVVIDRIVGSTLVRLRSRTVYYMLQRMQEAARAWRLTSG